jgi:hypothetical protein
LFKCSAEKNEDQTLNVAHSKLARSHLSILFYFSYHFKCFWLKKKKLNIGYQKTLLSPQEEKSRTLPHIAARCRHLRNAISVVAATAHRLPHAPRPPPHASRRTQSSMLPSPYRTSAYSPYPLHQAALRGCIGLLGLLLLLGDSRQGT